MKRIRKSGFTLIELMVSIVIFTCLLGLVIWVFYFTGNTLKVTDQLDAFHAARLLNYRISAELKFSNGVLYPVLPPEGNKSSPKTNQLIFRDAMNRVKAIFLTPKRELVMLDYERLIGSKVAPPIVLGWNVDGFEVVVHPTRAVEFKAFMNVDKQMHEILNQVLPANAL